MSTCDRSVLKFYVEGIQQCYPDVCAVYSKYLSWIAVGLSVTSSSASWSQDLQGAVG
jgi:hypothetical protein